MMSAAAVTPVPTSPVCVLKRLRFPLSAREATDGGTLNVLRIVEALLEEGIPVEVFTTREEGEANRETRGRLTVYRVDSQRSQAESPTVRGYEEGVCFVRAVLAQPAFWPYRYRALHVHHWSAAVGLPERLPPQVRVVYTPHLLAIEKERALGIRCPEAVLESERTILARANAIFALSRAEANSIRAMIPPHLQNPILTPNGIDQVFFSLVRRPREPSQPVRLLSIGRLATQKGHDHLLDAVAILLDRGLAVELTIDGGSHYDDDYEKTLLTRAQTPPFRGRVRFVGSVPHADIAQWMSRSDIYVQSSHYESQCVAILEAMAAGLPVITSRLDAICEYLEDRRHGLLYTAGNVTELAHCIETLVRKPQMADELANNARERARAIVAETTQREVLSQLREHADTASTGEVHDPLLAARLRNYATVRASELAQNADVQAVMLVGSVVNGSVGRGSDVNFYLLSSNEHTAPLVPPWQFVDGDTIENVHVLPMSRLKQGHDMLSGDDNLAEWFYRNPVGDYLVRSEQLVWNADRSCKDYIDDLVAARCRPEMWRRIALRYAKAADCLVDTARSLFEKGCAEDAHQVLRESAQHALVAAMIRLGWTLRGSKKRPEIASGFLPDEMIEMALKLVLDVVGLHDLSIATATKLSKDRLRVRSMLVAELHRLATRFDGVQSLLDHTMAHEHNAIDYYQHSVRSYLVRGPVNHIRCLSGFPATPAKVLRAVGQASDTPIRDFLACEILSTQLRDTWATVAALESMPKKVNEWLLKAETVLSDLRRACEGGRSWKR